MAHGSLFLQKLDNGAESGAADKLRADFEELRDDVNTFSVEVDGLMKHLKDQEGLINDKTKELQAQVNVVQGAMNQFVKHYFDFIAFPLI